jgi:enamine deaminase RidA (YjgF/YER057c/UK114 family)
MQQTLVAGDSLNFSTSTPQYPASSGWVLKYRLVPRAAGASVINLVGTAEGADHRVQAAAAVTASWAAGDYGWSAWVEKAGEVYTVDSGQIVVTPDPRQVAVGTDLRSLARKALEDARAALAAWNPTRRRYKIGEREMEFNGTADIIKLITYWQQQVDAEDQLAGRAERVGRRIFTRI